ncbi:MAG: tetratricopeptide repeat protein [Bdellovibrionales bacterium]|nr:tetratricopeptide repeat protein [Bdellovibrionales bacterium]
MKMLSATLKLLVCLSLGHTAMAAQPAVKKAKKPAAAKKAKAKGKSAEVSAVAAEPAAKKVTTPLDELRLVEGDEQGNEVKSLKAELLVTKAELQAIAQAQKLLKKYKNTALEPEIQFRLAELYMRKSKTDRFFEVHRESETVVRLAPRQVKESSSRSSVQNAVNIYSMIQNSFPSFAQMDLVIFNHAFARQALGQEKDAEGLYQNLINKHSSSPLVPDAHLAMGEIAFNRSQFALALDHFNAIRKYPESRVYPYGLYKAAWTHYNMRDAEKGLKKLEEVVAFGKFVEQSNTDARLDLRKEALNDMTLFYEDVYPAKDAYKYFREQAGAEEVGPILLKMATLYERHSRFNDQRVALQQFVQELPKSPLLPKVHTDLVLAYDHLREKDQAVKRMEDFSQLCKDDGRWVKSQVKNSEEGKKLSSECLTGLNDTALKLARKWLRAWKKLPSDTSYADASEKAFEIYLRTPADNDDYNESRYAYADLLFSRNKFRAASTQYAQVSRSGKAAKLGHDASYGAIVSLEKAVGEKWSSDDEKSFHQLATEYVQKNPKGAYRLDIEYKMALLAYERNRYDEAAPTFVRLGREFPTQEKGMKSQDLYLDILNLKKDYRGIRNYTTELMKLSADPTRGQKMQKLYEQAYFLEIQGLEEKNRLKEALAEYLAFAKQNPSSDLAEKAVWNAMQLQFKTGDLWNGAKTAEQFATQFPKSPQAVNSLLRAAQTFEQMAQLSEAARVLTKLAAKDEKASARWKELAADFHALQDEMPAARKLYGELKTNANAEQRVKIMRKLEALEKNYGSEQSHAEVLRAMIDQNIQPQANLARVELAEKMYAKNQLTEAFNEARRQQTSSMPKDLKARLRLIQAKVLEQEFLKQSVKSRAERVGSVLAIKTEKLVKAQEALQDTIKLGNARVSMEAFERLYGCYAHYVKALKEMPTPAGLTAEDEKAFRAEIDNLVVPLEEKSVDTLAQAVQFARKQPFLDSTAVRLENELNVLNKQVVINVAPSLTKPEVMLPVVAGVGP